jgi:hypothetical protein
VVIFDVMCVGTPYWDERLQRRHKGYPRNWAQPAILGRATAAPPQGLPEKLRTTRHIGTSDCSAATRATRETAHNSLFWDGASNVTTRATLELRTRSLTDRSRTYRYTDCSCTHADVPTARVWRHRAGHLGNLADAAILQRAPQRGNFKR